MGAPRCLHFSVSCTRWEHRALYWLVCYSNWSSTFILQWNLADSPLVFLGRILAEVVFILGLDRKLLGENSSESGLGSYGVLSWLSWSLSLTALRQSLGSLFLHLNHKGLSGMVTKILGTLYFTFSINLSWQNLQLEWRLSWSLVPLLFSPANILSVFSAAQCLSHQRLLSMSRPSCSLQTPGSAITFFLLSHYHCPFGNLFWFS